MRPEQGVWFLVTTYGFRLFLAWPRKGDGRLPTPFHQGGGVGDLADYFANLWSGAEDRREVGSPHAPSPDEEPDTSSRTPAPGETLLCVEEVRRTGRHVELLLRYGRFGNHDRATSPAGPEEDRDIQGRPPTQLYRAVLILPDGAGDEAGILAVETIGTACPYGPLQKWSRWWASKDPIKDDSGAAAWWKLILHSLGDDDLLNSYLARAKPESLSLKRHKEGRNRVASKEEIRLTASLDTEAASRAARRELKRWAKAHQDGEHIDREAAAASVAGILGPEVADIGFDEAALSVQDEEFGTRTIKPNQMSDVFTYIIGDMPPDDSDFRARVRRAVSRVLYEGKPEFDWTSWPPPRR